MVAEPVHELLRGLVAVLVLSRHDHLRVASGRVDEATAQSRLDERDLRIAEQLAPETLNRREDLG
jgi:hypothetical protein